MPPAPDDDDSKSGGGSYQSLDTDVGRPRKPSLTQRLSASLSNATLAALFKRSPSPPNATTTAAPLLASYNTSDLASPASARQRLRDQQRPDSADGDTDTALIDPALQPHLQHDEQYQPLPSLIREPVAYFTAVYHNVASLASSLYAAQLMSLTYLHAETKRNYRGFVVGLFTVLLVVAVIALIQNNTLKSPVIFFKVAENTVGETDLVITPGAGNADVVVDRVAGLPLLNQSWFDEALAGADGVAGTSGRWLFFTRILSPLHLSDRQYIASALMLGVNSVKEREMELGRAWEWPPLQPYHAYISRSIIRQVGYTVEEAPGKQVLLRVDVFDFAKQLNIIPGESNADPTAEDVITLLTVLDPQSFPSSYWAETRNFSLNVTNVPSLPPNATYEQTIHTIVNSNERLILPVTAFNTTVYVSNTFTAWITYYNAIARLSGQPTTSLSQVEAALVQVPECAQPTVVTLLTGGVLQPTNRDLLQLSLPYIVNASRYDVSFTVAGVLDEPAGKWPEALGSIVMVENAQLIELVKGSVWHLLNANITAIDLSACNDTAVRSTLPLPYPVPVRRLLILSGQVNASDVQRVDALANATIGSLDGDKQSLLSIVNYKQRVSTYLKDLDSMNADLIRFTDTVALSIGLDYPATFTTPIAATLTITQYIRYFLDNIFYSVVALMVFLGVLLIFSLLLHDVDSKTYEYGMLRALGMRHRTLIQVLVTKALLFAIPGILLGLLIAYLLNMPVDASISDYAAIPHSSAFYQSPLLLAIAVGLIMPLVANIVPISRALSRTLRDSLDVYHHVVSEVTVRVIKLADLGLNLWQTALAVLMVVIGFVTFYVVPYSFIFVNYPLFLGILNGILLGMLLGLCIIAQAIQPMLERAVLRVMLSCCHRHLHAIVKKNLSGHRSRNGKTAQMFTICLAFVLFAGVMFSLQANSLIDNVKSLLAADINIQALPNDLKNSLAEAEMTQYLDRQIVLRQAGVADAIVDQYTFVPFPINNLAYVRSVQFSSLPKFQSVRNYVYGVSPNYLSVVYDQYYIVSEYAQTESDYPRTPSGKPDAIAMMYTQAGDARLPEEADGLVLPRSTVSGYKDVRLDTAYNVSRSDAVIRSDYLEYIDVVMGEALRGWQSVNTHTPLNLYIRTNWGYDIYGNYLCKARAMVTKVPGFLYSSYRVSASLAAVLIRQEQYDRLMQDAGLWDYYNQTSPKQRLLIKLTPGSSLAQREDVINALRTFFKSDRTIVTDTQRIIDTTMVAVDMMNLFFTSIGVVTQLMCFFILWLSFTANVHENSWEFGVLRALGVNQFEVVMVYVYEALTVVLTSLALGTTIGLVIAASLTAQFNLFTEMPFNMTFPHSLFWTLVVLSIIIAIVGSAWPAYRFLRYSISNVLRGQ